MPLSDGGQLSIQRLRSMFDHAALTRCILVVVGASALVAGAQAEEEKAATGTSVDKSPTMERILANWKARQVRIKTFHVSWESRVRLRPGRHVIRVANGRTTVLMVGEAPLVFDPLPMANFWMAGNDRFRYERRTALERVAEGTWAMSVSDGRSEMSCLVRSDFRRQARLPTDADEDEGRRSIELIPILLSFRPLVAETPGWDPRRCRLVTEHAVIDNVHYIKIQRVGEEPGILDTWWIDPRREDVIAQWQRAQNGREVARISIEYEPRPGLGLVPHRWTIENFVWKWIPAATIKSKVTECTINEEPQADTFSPRFPLESLVFDHGKQKFFFVRVNGSKWAVTKDELRRGIGYADLKVKD